MILTGLFVNDHTLFLESKFRTTPVTLHKKQEMLFSAVETKSIWPYVST